MAWDNKIVTISLESAALFFCLGSQKANLQPANIWGETLFHKASAGIKKFHLFICLTAKYRR